METSHIPFLKVLEQLLILKNQLSNVREKMRVILMGFTVDGRDLDQVLHATIQVIPRLVCQA